MPLHDLTCPNNHERRDVWLRLGERPPCPECGEPVSTLWDQASGVIGDECDVKVANGLCHEDGSPRHFTSKAAMNRFAEAHGWTNYVVHRGTKGGDKSKHTVRWQSIPQNEEERLKHWRDTIGAELGLTPESVEAIYQNRRRGVPAEGYSETKAAIYEAIAGMR